MNGSDALANSPGLLSADGLVGLVFLVMIAVSLAGAYIAATSERLVRAVAGLVVCFTGVAGVYYFLNSPFVAMMQILKKRPGLPTCSPGRWLSWWQPLFSPGWQYSRCALNGNRLPKPQWER